MNFSSHENCIFGIRFFWSNGFCNIPNKFSRKKVTIFGPYFVSTQNIAYIIYVMLDNTAPRTPRTLHHQHQLATSRRSVSVTMESSVVQFRIPTVKLKIPGKSRIPNFCYIQVIVFDLSYLPMAAVGTKQVCNHEKIEKNRKDVFHIFSWLRTCLVPTAATGR